MINISFENTFSNHINENCKKHMRMKEIVCVDCEVVMCHKCAIFDHSKHNLKEIHQINEEIADNIENVLNLQASLKKTKSIVDSRSWEQVLNTK